ncbi:CoA-binding protein [Halobacillus shinanisalinarum]|uniref:CoA-binding protein n=1 Tax=Halobacillus shinanisalinarum TaxID=2932258 RepID=A0ABY4GZJ1_9BACI|nr:CoA-binding protein [Halobacillus shinanisalinarum]UOQ93451.1 CoA-binding protein [Halobacillus shinanisalinarum]
MFTNPDQEQIKKLLSESKTIAVVGLSDKPHRTSYQVSEAMQRAGYKIIPVNPTITESLGEKSYQQLSDVDQPIDIVNVFRRSEYLPKIAQEAASIDFKAFWGQQGVFHEEAYAALKSHDGLVIMDTCIKVAHSILVGK